jgi:hypothetical protein
VVESEKLNSTFTCMLKDNTEKVRFEVLRVVKMTMFWDVMLCGLVGRYQCFGKKILSPSSALKMETVCCMFKL